MQSAGRVGSRRGKVSGLTIIVPSARRSPAPRRPPHPPGATVTQPAATTREDRAHGELRLRRGDHRLGVRRQRRRAACRGEGLPGRRHGVRQALEGRRHPEDPVGPAATSCGSPPPSCTGSSGSSTSTTCSSCPVRAWAAARTSTPTRCTSRRSSSSTRRSGRASPTGPTSWPRTSTRRAGCSASSATRTCPPTSTASCSRSRPRWGGGRRSTRPRWASTSAAPASRPTTRTSAASGPRRTGCISCGNCNIGCGHNAKNKLTTNYLYLAEKLGAEVHELHEVYDLVPLDGGGFEVHARHPGWAQRAAHLHHHTYTAEQVIVAAHAYGSAKLLHHMQHTGRLTGLSEPARAASADELRAASRDHPDPRRVGARSGEDPPHAGVGVDHLRRLAGSA